MPPDIEKSGNIGIIIPESMGDIMDDDPEYWLTYDEAAERLGIKPDSVRRRAASRKWARRQGNDGLARVRIPPDAIRNTSADDTPARTPDDPDDRLRNEIAQLREELAASRAETSGIRDRLADAQSDRDRWRSMAEKLSEAQPPAPGLFARIFRR